MMDAPEFSNETTEPATLADVRCVGLHCYAERLQLAGDRLFGPEQQ